MKTKVGKKEFKSCTLPAITTKVKATVLKITSANKNDTVHITKRLQVIL